MLKRRDNHHQFAQTSGYADLPIDPRHQITSKCRDSVIQRSKRASRFRSESTTAEIIFEIHISMSFFRRR